MPDVIVEVANVMHDAGDVIDEARDVVRVGDHVIDEARDLIDEVRDVVHEVVDFERDIAAVMHQVAHVVDDLSTVMRAVQRRALRASNRGPKRSRAMAPCPIPCRPKNWLETAFADASGARDHGALCGSRHAAWFCQCSAVGARPLAHCGW